MINKKQITIIIITTIFIAISAVLLYLFINNKDKGNTTLSSVIYLPAEEYSNLTNIRSTFNSNISTSNNINIYVDLLNENNFEIPKTINIYNYRDLNEPERKSLISTIAKTTGLQILNGEGRDKTQTVYIEPETNFVSYINEIDLNNVFQQKFNDEIYLPRAKEAAKAMGFDLSNYEYTKYAYLKRYGKELLTVNKASEANAIQYSFRRNLDGYIVLTGEDNVSKSVLITLDTKGNLIKVQAFPFGYVEDIKVTLPTKTLDQIKQAILDGSITNAGGDVNIVGETIKSLTINKAEIFYSTNGNQAIPLIDLSCKVVTVNGEVGNAFFVTDLIDLDKIDVLNK